MKKSTILIFTIMFVNFVIVALVILFMGINSYAANKSFAIPVLSSFFNFSQFYKQDLVPNNSIAVNATPAIKTSCYKLDGVESANKEKIDILLKDYKISYTYGDIYKANEFEIYWNLGSNSANAQVLFNKQKTGMFKDKSFTLSKDQNNNFVVPITSLATEEEAKNTIITFNGYKLGGEWKYKAKARDLYAYNISSVTEELKPVVTALQNKFNFSKNEYSCQ